MKGPFRGYLEAWKFTNRSRFSFSRRAAPRLCTRIVLGLGGLRSNHTARRSDDSQPLANLLQDVQSKLQLLPGMSGGHDSSYARFGFGYRRITDALSKYTFLKKFVRKSHGQIAFSDNNRSNRSFAGTGIEAEATEA